MNKRPKVKSMKSQGYLTGPTAKQSAPYILNEDVHNAYLSQTGKDITNKLYSITEHLQLGNRTVKGSRCNSSTNSTGTTSAWPWVCTIPRSLSVDAVHTGATGHLRSQNWNLSVSRGSPLHYDSCVHLNVQVTSLLEAESIRPMCPACTNVWVRDLGNARYPVAEKTAVSTPAKSSKLPQYSDSKTYRVHRNVYGNRAKRKPTATALVHSGKPAQVLLQFTKPS
ncbi:hypothetical protein GQR58_004929 [Nymphon striatum]|nr:hypothetical protein GQR58_004929 [Nymphon striatum]